jgi:hypothetical protein
VVASLHWEDAQQQVKSACRIADITGSDRFCHAKLPTAFRPVSVGVSCLSFQRIYILETVQKSFISMKRSLLS